MMPQQQRALQRELVNALAVQGLGPRGPAGAVYESRDTTVPIDEPSIGELADCYQHLVIP
jgi:hypothetical protein